MTFGRKWFNITRFLEKAISFREKIRDIPGYEKKSLQNFCFIPDISVPVLPPGVPGFLGTFRKEFPQSSSHPAV